MPPRALCQAAPTTHAYTATRVRVQHSMFAKLGAIIETTQVCLSPSHPIAAVYGACRATYGAFNVIYGSCGAIYG
eukprot:586555-Rhodomonas_salina.1